MNSRKQKVSVIVFSAFIISLLGAAFLLNWDTLGGRLFPQSPTAFATQTTAADSAVATDWNHASKVHLNRESTAKIVQAISTSRRHYAECTDSLAGHVEFYRGSERLSSMDIAQKGMFFVQSNRYLDSSSVLENLQQELCSEKAGKLWADELAHDLAKSDFARLQTWGSEVFHRYRNNELRFRETGNTLELLSEEIPDWVKILFPVPPSEIAISLDSEKNPLYLDVNWHSSAYGILVGGSDFTIESSESLYITNAAPGVYVYRSNAL